MTRTSETTPATRLLLALAATAALLLGMSLASPAAAFVVDDDDADTAEPAESEDNGFVNDEDEQESPPVGGVDAGFGGAAADQAGLGALHATALGLLGLALAGHLAHLRRTSAART